MLNVGVDLHKTQMTVCFLFGTSEPLQKVYRTDKSGYEAFCQDIKSFGIVRKKIRIGVETTGNVWFFVKQMLPTVTLPDEKSRAIARVTFKCCG